MKHEYFESVWDAIEPDKAVAANLKARVDVMIAIQETVKAWRITQAAAATRFNTTQTPPKRPATRPHRQV